MPIIRLPMRAMSASPRSTTSMICPLNSTAILSDRRMISESSVEMRSTERPEAFRRSSV